MVQTFLPYSDFVLSAKSLDCVRLNKQRLEVIWILESLATGGRGYNHPAAKMWSGYEEALILYGVAICDECDARGIRDNAGNRSKILSYTNGATVKMPHWLGMKELHASHRGNLLRKDHTYYGKYGWVDSPLLPYVWPGGSHADPAARVRSTPAAS